MIRIEMPHDGGFGSVLTMILSNLLKLPAGEKADVYANSKHYADPGVNMIDWYFAVDVSSELPAETWYKQYFEELHNHNTLLGRDTARVQSLRAVARQHLPIKPHLLQAARYAACGARIGVHYRGTDKFTETPRVSYEAFEKTIRALPGFEPMTPIFLSTDEQAALEWFCERFNVVANKSHFRTNRSDFLCAVGEGGRKAADEAVRDILCLATCPTLVVGRGNFSDMAIVFGETADIHYPGEETS